MSDPQSQLLRLPILALSMLLTSVSAFALGDDVSPEASEEVRRDSAREKLTANPSIVVLYAEGLCCPSCAIGVRKKVSRLDYIDRSRFNKGVDLDAKTQLVSVAVNVASNQVDLDTLAQAVVDAGYTPVRTYHLDADELHTTALKAE